MDKEKIKQACLNIVDKKLENIQKTLDNYKIDLLSEAKSSAGDKHETGRAMLQLEMEKLGQQYQTVLTQKNTIAKINNLTTKVVGVGSLVSVNGNCYFLASSIGRLMVDGVVVMVLSINSPIGKQLLGKKGGDHFWFNEREFVVDQVF